MGNSNTKIKAAIGVVGILFLILSIGFTSGGDSSVAGSSDKYAGAESSSQGVFLEPETGIAMKIPEGFIPREENGMQTVAFGYPNTAYMFVKNPATYVAIEVNKQNLQDKALFAQHQQHYYYSAEANAINTAKSVGGDYEMKTRQVMVDDVPFVEIKATVRDANGERPPLTNFYRMAPFGNSLITVGATCMANSCEQVMASIDSLKFTEEPSKETEPQKQSVDAEKVAPKWHFDFPSQWNTFLGPKRFNPEQKVQLVKGQGNRVSLYLSPIDGGSLGSLQEAREKLYGGLSQQLKKMAREQNLQVVEDSEDINLGRRPFSAKVIATIDPATNEPQELVSLVFGQVDGNVAVIEIICNDEQSCTEAEELVKNSTFDT